MANENNNEQVQQAVNQALSNEKKKKKKKRLIFFGVIAGIIILLIIISSLGGNGNSSDKTGVDNTDKSSAVSAEKNTKTDGQIGNYICTVKSAKICNDWAGKKAVMITYEFTNNSNDAESFDFALKDDVYQDGIGLETSFIDGDADEIGLDVKIKPGTSKDVTKVYILRDETTPLEIEITELISLSDDKLTYNVDLK